MIKAPRWRGCLVLGALIIAIATMVHLLRATPATPKVNLDAWVHLSSKTGDLPVRGESDQQTASLVLDVDQDGLGDFVIGARAQAPGLI